MKKIKITVLGIMIVLLGFYFTNKITINMRNEDILMKEILKTKEKYKISPIDAIVIGNTIISGVKGKEIDYEKSYHNMKEYGTYNESLTVMKEITPVVSINDNYDKYLIGGNNSKRNISIVFKVYKETNIDKILSILKSKKINATFFLDGTYMENNLNQMNKLKGNEVEILSYNKEYNKALLKTTISYIESITKEKVKFCYTERENEELLNICKKEKLHTIKPTIVIKNNLYKQKKNNIENSTIISLEVNNYIEKELPITIDYIKSKGYSIEKLSKLLEE